MKMMLSEQAEKQLRERIRGGNQKIKLVYDTAECGCPVNGVAQLWLVGEPAQDDIRLHKELPLYCSPRDEVFFEETLHLAYDEKKRCYLLKSDQMTYHSALTLKEMS